MRKINTCSVLDHPVSVGDIIDFHDPDNDLHIHLMATDKTWATCKECPIYLKTDSYVSCRMFIYKDGDKIRLPLCLLNPLNEKGAEYTRFIELDSVMEDL